MSFGHTKCTCLCLTDVEMSCRELSPGMDSELEIQMWELLPNTLSPAKSHVSELGSDSSLDEPPAETPAAAWIAACETHGAKDPA